MELMHAHSFSTFLSTVYPMKVKTNQKLVSEDRRNNTANIKHTIVCDMVPLNRHDLIVCDKRAAREGCSAGRLNGKLCLVNKISSSLHFVDASPARTGIKECFTDLHPEKYWKGEKYFRILFSANRMVRYVVMDVDLCDDYGGGHDSAADSEDADLRKYALADVIVAREADIGVSDETFHCTTHLGNILDIGDNVMGYDLVSSVLTGGDEWAMDNSFISSFSMPDVVLVKKVNHLAEGTVKAQQDGSKSQKKKKAKSSVSKKREKRNRKQEKKAKDFMSTMNRMGFGGSGDYDVDQDDELWDTERKKFEEDLEEDVELADEFRSIVEKNIELGGNEADPKTESSTGQKNVRSESNKSD
jgi:nonsense-mediated mRNA decay protein 3